ncbi:hypothetical protein E1298_46520, partial [Actinomadura rubrisoli]
GWSWAWAWVPRSPGSPRRRRRPPPRRPPRGPCRRPTVTAPAPPPPRDDHRIPAWKRGNHAMNIRIKPAGGPYFGMITRSVITVRNYPLVRIPSGLVSCRRCDR